MGQVGPNSITKKWTLYVALYTVTTLNFISMSLFSPLINRQLRILEISPMLVGIVGSIYGATSLAISPFIGLGCERYGVSLLFVSALIGTVLNNCAQVFTISITIFVIARSSAGFLKQTATLGKLLLTQFTKRNEIAWGLGYLGAFSNLGVVIGPSLGAYFLQFEDGQHLVFMLALGMNAIMILLTAKLLWISPVYGRKEPSKSHTESESAAKLSTKTKNFDKSIRSHVRLFLKSERQLLFIFAMKFCFTFASHGIRSSFPLIMQRKYSASESAIGYLNSIQSTTAMLIGFIVSPVIYYVYRNDHRRITMHAGTLQMVSFICQIISPTFMWSSISCLLLEISNPFLWVSTIAVALEYKPPCNTQISTATIVSLSTTLANISQMVAPLGAGASMVIFNGNDGPPFISACSSLIGVLITWLLIPGSKSGGKEQSQSPTESTPTNESNTKLKQG